MQTHTSGQFRINQITAHAHSSPALTAVGGRGIPEEYARVGGRVVSAIKGPLRKQRLYCVHSDTALNL